MQTFLPYYLYLNCAEVLDNKRLNKQRIECFQIYTAYQTGGSWANHPATRMWANKHEKLSATFYRYWHRICDECDHRGFQDSKNLERLSHQLQTETAIDKDLPWWQEDPDHYYAIAYTHAINLLWKDPAYYRNIFKCGMDGISSHLEFQEYLWPCMDGTNKFWRFTDRKHKTKEFLDANSAEVMTLATLHKTQIQEST